MQLSKDEQAKLDTAQSIMSLASNPAWKAMCEALLAGEAMELSKLENYLENDPHPDREEVMTMCLRWYGVRHNRKILVRNVQEAHDFKQDLSKSLIADFAQDPSQPVPEDLRDLLLETL